MNTNIIRRYYNSHPVIIDSLASIFVRSGSVISRTIFLFVTAKYLESKTFGLLALVISLLDIHRAVFDFGTDIYSIRFFSTTKDNIKKGIIDVGLLKLFTMTIGYFTFIILCNLIYGRESILLATVLGITLFTTSFINLYINYFQSQLAINKILATSVIQNTLFIIIIMSYYFSRQNIVIFASILPLCDIIYILLLYPKLKNEVGILRYDFHIDLTFIYKILLRSFPLGVAAIIVTIYTRIDTILINHYFGKVIAANYSLSYRITEPFIMLSTPFFVSSYSHLSHMVNKAKQENIVAFCKRFLSATTGMSFAISTIIFIIAPYFISYMYPEYDVGPNLVRIFCIALLFRIISSGLSSIILSFGKFHWITYVSTLNIFNFFTIFYVSFPVMGIFSGAVAITITEAINSIIQLIMVTKLMTSILPQGAK